MIKSMTHGDCILPMTAILRMNDLLFNQLKTNALRQTAAHSKSNSSQLADDVGITADHFYLFGLTKSHFSESLVHLRSGTKSHDPSGYSRFDVRKR
jgi:hypothetical protein